MEFIKWLMISDVETKLLYMNLPLMNVDWEGATKESITLPSLVERSLEMILIILFLRQIGLKSLTDGVSLF